jgi:hypothetical protein
MCIGKALPLFVSENRRDTRKLAGVAQNIDSVATPGLSSRRKLPSLDSHGLLLVAKR